MNFTINQTNGIRETVNSEFINKLYNLFITNKGSHTISLSGYLYSPTGYKAQMDALNQQYGPDLVIEVPAVGQYILFHDPEVTNVLKTSIGNGEGVTLSLLKNADPNSSLGLNNNTNITDTRELCLIEGTGTNGGFCYQCTNIKILGIPKNVTSFGYGYTDGINPEKLVIGDMVNFCKTKFGSHNFNRYNNGNGVEICTLNDDGSLIIIKDLILPSNTQFIDDIWYMPFDSANIDSVVIPAGTNVIGGFQQSKLKSMVIEQGSQATTIQANAFYRCSNLVFNVANLPQSITIIRENAFKECTNLTGELNLPNLVSLRDGAFMEVNLQSINCPKLISLGDGAFWGGENIKLSSVECLGKVQEIPGHCFLYRTQLQTAKIPYECTKIGDEGFQECFALTTIKQYTQSVDDWVEGTTPTYGDITRVTQFGNNAFIECRSLILNASTLSSAVTIGNRSFENCSLLTGTLNLPNLISIGQRAFYGTGITSITYLGRVTSIPNYCFQNCTSLTSVTLPSTCKTIASQAFDGCTSLTSINLDNIESISGYYAFRNAGITDYVLPKIKNLGARNLSACSNAYLLDCGSDLTTIASDALWDSGFSIFIFRGTTPPSFSGTSFEYNMTGRIIYVPDATVTDYQTAWPNMASYITGLSNYNPS